MRVAASSKSPSFQPLYMQIKALLVASLDGGEWPPGEAIPSEMALAQRFRVSQGTVRKAIDELAAQSLWSFDARERAPSFRRTPREKASLFRFLRIRRNDGRDEHPSAASSNPPREGLRPKSRVPSSSRRAMP